MPLLQAAFAESGLATTAESRDVSRCVADGAGGVPAAACGQRRNHAKCGSVAIQDGLAATDKVFALKPQSRARPRDARTAGAVVGAKGQRRAAKTRSCHRRDQRTGASDPARCAAHGADVEFASGGAGAQRVEGGVRAVRGVALRFAQPRAARLRCDPRSRCPFTQTTQASSRGSSLRTFHPTRTSLRRLWKADLAAFGH